MGLVSILLLLVHVVVCLAVVLAVARLGRSVARLLRQPVVIGEVTMGLLLGPALLWIVGARSFDLLLPEQVLEALEVVAQAGLALFLVGLIYELRTGRLRPGTGALTWVVAGALVPSLMMGLLLGLWVVFVEAPEVRGTASLLAFGLFVAVSLSITAVPVLARILTDRGQMDTVEGRLALTAAIIVDGLGWVLLAVVLSVHSGSSRGFTQVLALLLTGAAVVFLARRLLASKPVSSFGLRFPWLCMTLLGATAVTVGMGAEHLGLTLPVGAALVALAVPVTEPNLWATHVASIARVGRALVPIFFVVTGITVLTSALGSATWTLVLVATGLAIVGKVGGGYVGARLGKQPRLTSLRIGVLINTRGLTELVLLQIGFSADIITPPLFLALVVMTLVTTALTGPTLALIDRVEVRRESGDLQGIPVK